MDEEETIILPKAPLSVPDNLLLSPTVDSQPQTMPPLFETQSPPDSSSKATKVHITPELESIVASVVLFVSFPLFLSECTVGSDMVHRG